MKITEADLRKEGIFRTRGNKDGRKQWPMEVISINGTDNYPILAIIHYGDGDSVDTFMADGRNFSVGPGSYDITRISPYDHIKTYDPVVVWADDSTLKHLLTFSSSDSFGKAITFTYLGGPKTAWDNCVLLTDYIKEHGEL